MRVHKVWRGRLKSVAETEGRGRKRARDERALMVMRSNVGGNMMSHQHMRHSAHLFNKRHARRGKEYIPLHVKIAMGFVCLFFVYLVVVASGVITKIRHHKTKNEVAYKDTMENEVKIHETIDKNHNLQQYASHAQFADGTLLLMDDTNKGAKAHVYNLEGTSDFHGHLNDADEQSPRPDKDVNAENMREYVYESKLGISDASMAKEKMQLTIKKSTIVPSNVTGVADWFDEDDYRQEVKVVEWDTILADQRKMHTSKASGEIPDSEMVMRYVYSMREPILVKNSPAKTEWESVKKWTDGSSIQSSCNAFVQQFIQSDEDKMAFQKCQILMSHKLDNMTNFLEDEEGNNSNPFEQLFIKAKGFVYDKQDKNTRTLRLSNKRTNGFEHGDKDIYKEYFGYENVFTEGMAVAKNTFEEIFKRRLERVYAVVRPKTFYGPMYDLMNSEKVMEYFKTNPRNQDAIDAEPDRFKRGRGKAYDFNILKNAEDIMKYFNGDFKKMDTIAFYFMMSQTAPAFYRVPKATDAGDMTYKEPLQFTVPSDRTHFTVANRGSSGDTTRNFYNRIIASMSGKSRVAIWTSAQWQDLVMLPTWHNNYPGSHVYKREDSGIYNSCVKKADASAVVKVRPYSVVDLEPGDVLYIPPLWTTRVLCENEDGGYNAGGCINLEAEVAMPKMVFNHADNAHHDTDIPEADIEASKNEAGDDAATNAAVDFSRNYNRLKKTATESCLDMVSFAQGDGSCFDDELKSTTMMIQTFLVKDIQERCFLNYGTEVTLNYAQDKVISEMERNQPFSIYNILNGKIFMGTSSSLQHEVLDDIRKLTPEEYELLNIEAMEKADRGQHLSHGDKYKDAPVYYDPTNNQKKPFQKLNTFLQGRSASSIWARVSALMDNAKDEYFPEAILDSYQQIYNIGNWKLRAGYEKGDVTNGYQEMDPLKKRDMFAAGFLKEIDFEVTRTFPCERAAEASGYVIFNYVKKILQYYPKAGDVNYELPEGAKKKRRDPDTGIRAVYAPAEDAEKLARKLFTATAQRYATETSGVLGGIRSGFGCLAPVKKECFHFKRDISPEYRQKMNLVVNEAVVEAIREYKRIKRILVQQRYHVFNKDKVAKTAAFDPEIVEDTWVDVDDYEDDGVLDEHFAGIVGSYLSDFADNMAAGSFNTPLVACTFLSCLSIADNEPPPPEEAT